MDTAQPSGQPAIGQSRPPGRLRGRAPVDDSTCEPGRQPEPEQASRQHDEESHDERDEQIAEHGDTRRQDAEGRPVESHPSEVDREEREDQHQDPVAVDRLAASFLVLELFGERRDFGPLFETEVANHRLPRVGRIEDRSHRDAPGSSEDAQRPGDRNHPVGGPAAEQAEQRHEREVAEGRPAVRGERAAGLSRGERMLRVSDSVEDEPAAEENDQRPRGKVRSVEEQESHEEGDGAAHPRLALPRVGRTPEAVEQLQGGRDDQERAHPRFGRRPGTHGQQGEASERRRHGREPPAALRGFGQCASGIRTAGSSSRKRSNAPTSQVTSVATRALRAHEAIRAS